jgi:hypothetical protein
MVTALSDSPMMGSERWMIGQSGLWLDFPRMTGAVQVTDVSMAALSP